MYRSFRISVFSLSSSTWFAYSLFRNSSLSRTEAIVDFALRFGRPFAVVPCCVFACEFPGRRSRDGAPVVSYSQFVRYLCDKVEATPGRAVHREFLPLKGKNLVIYSFAPSSSGGGSEH